MRKPSKAKDRALIQRFNNLEKQWESIKMSKTRNRRRYSTGSNTSFDQLLEISPRMLMSTLQLRRSPSYDGFLNVEILRDRHTAITSGKLKGKRLFAGRQDLKYEDGSCGDDDGGEVCNEWSNAIVPAARPMVVNNGSCSGSKIKESQEKHDAFCDSCSVSDSSSFLEKEMVVVDDEKILVEVANVVEKRGSGTTLRACRGDCSMGIAWFAFVMFLFILGIVALSCHASVHEIEVIQVPT